MLIRLITGKKLKTSNVRNAHTSIAKRQRTSSELFRQLNMLLLIPSPTLPRTAKLQPMIRYRHRSIHVFIGDCALIFLFGILIFGAHQGRLRGGFAPTNFAPAILRQQSCDFAGTTGQHQSSKLSSTIQRQQSVDFARVLWQQQSRKCSASPDQNRPECVGATAADQLLAKTLEAASMQQSDVAAQADSRRDRAENQFTDLEIASHNAVGDQHEDANAKSSSDDTFYHVKIALKSDLEYRARFLQLLEDIEVCHQQSNLLDPNIETATKVSCRTH